MARIESVDPNESFWHWMASDLRFYREKYGLSLSQLGKILNCVRQTVSNIEYARPGFRLDETKAKKLDELWDLNGHFGRLLHHARAGHDVDWFKQYTGYEALAVALRIYQGKVIPNALQTEEYTQAFLTACGVENVEAEVADRMARQEVLNRPKPPDVWVLLDQNVLESPVGGPEVMRRQLAHLLELGSRNNVSIRVVPRSAGVHMGFDGAFQVISLGARDVAYAGALRGGRLIEVAAEVRSFGVIYDRIGAKAIPEDSSRSLIEQIMEGLR